MSLLEDVFLQDEADEAQQLERIIEGDEFEDERPNRDENSDSDDNSEKEDEASEDKRRVDPNSTKTKRVVKNPRVTLNPARLTGPRGIQVIPDHFKDFKFKGKGHEKDDLDMVLKKLEHWAYRLYPKFQFEDCLKKIETLGKKRPVMVHLHKIRSDQLLTEETVVQRDSSEDEQVPQDQVEDEFDKLLQQQIDIARATPAPGSVHKPDVTSTPMVDRRSSLTAPKASASPSISDEQKERMIRNRKLAEERRLARIKAQGSDKIKRVLTNVKRLDVINSDDEEVEVTNANKAITVENHNNVNENVTNDENTEGNSSRKVSNDVIDLDVADNETVKVSKKHNKTNVIDSSDDDGDVPETNNHSKLLDNIIDITPNANDNITYDKNAEDNSLGKVRNDLIDLDVADAKTDKVSKKHNKTNVIDSSDEDGNVPKTNRHSKLLNNIIENAEDNSLGKARNDLIDLDVADAKTVKVSKKHNKINVIESSDEDDHVPETKRQSKSRDNIIDITEGYKQSTIVHNELIDLSNVGLEVTGNVNEQLSLINSNKATSTVNVDNVVDLTEGLETNLKTTDEGNVKKPNENTYNRHNVIDSSEDDNSCDVIQINQVITADVHDMVIDDERDKNGELFDNKSDKNLENAETCKEVNDIEINDDIGIKLDSKISGAAKATNNVIENNLELNNRTKNDVDPAEDLMDVDFTDDF